jgi:hypothetical protein
MTTQAGVYHIDNCLSQGGCAADGCGGGCVTYSPRIAYLHYKNCVNAPCPSSPNGNSAYANGPGCGGLITAHGCYNTVPGYLWECHNGHSPNGYGSVCSTHGPVVACLNYAFMVSLCNCASSVCSKICISENGYATFSW